MLDAKLNPIAVSLLPKWCLQTYSVEYFLTSRCRFFLLWFWFELLHLSLKIEFLATNVTLTAEKYGILFILALEIWKQRSISSSFVTESKKSFCLICLTMHELFKVCYLITTMNFISVGSLTIF